MTDMEKINDILVRTEHISFREGSVRRMIQMNRVVDIEGQEVRITSAEVELKTIETDQVTFEFDHLGNLKDIYSTGDY